MVNIDRAATRQQQLLESMQLGVGASGAYLRGCSSSCCGSLQLIPSPHERAWHLLRACRHRMRCRCKTSAESGSLR